MYAFLVFFEEKHCTLIVYITEFFLKSGGPNALLPPPPSKIWGGGMAPWPPPCGGPHAILYVLLYMSGRVLSVVSSTFQFNAKPSVETQIFNCLNLDFSLEVMKKLRKLKFFLINKLFVNFYSIIEIFIENLQE